MVVVFSDWSIDDHFPSGFKSVQISSESPSLKVSIWSVELNQDVGVTFLIDSGDWGVWLLNLISIMVFSTKNW